jgi:hypothetical protein
MNHFEGNLLTLSPSYYQLLWQSLSESTESDVSIGKSYYPAISNLSVRELVVSRPPYGSTHDLLGSCDIDMATAEMTTDYE